MGRDELLSSLRNWRNWREKTWIFSGLVGLGVFIFLLAIGFWTLLSLILGVVAFLAVALWINREDPFEASSSAPSASTVRELDEIAAGPPMGAPAAKLYDAPRPEPDAPAQEAQPSPAPASPAPAPSAPAPSEPAPSAAEIEPAATEPPVEPDASPPPSTEEPPSDSPAAPIESATPASADAAPMAETVGESQRVKDAAREAAELARSMAAPAAAAPPPAAASPSEKPARLDAPREGGADDLKKIKGVGPKLEETLHGLGYYHFDQIAAWTASEAAWVDNNLEGFSGRATRDDWVGQAKVLASGAETEFSKRVEDGGVYDE